MNKFFLCYVSGSGRASRRHDTLEKAEKEAKRLSELVHNKDRTVFVLETREQYRAGEIEKDTGNDE